jgi:hypothetical protein
LTVEVVGRKAEIIKSGDSFLIFKPMPVQCRDRFEREVRCSSPAPPPLPCNAMALVVLTVHPVDPVLTFCPVWLRQQRSGATHHGMAATHPPSGTRR